MAERRSLSEVASASARLTALYRAGTPPTAFSDIEAEAYAAVRAPATFAAASAVMREVASRVNSFEPRSVADLGAGTGAGTDAARAVWPSIARADLYERSATMIGASSTDATWHRDDIAHARIAAADLVCAVYSLGELDASARDAVVGRAWDATTGVLVVIEPGTPSGYRMVLGVRDLLIGAGAELLAPCPHMAACPMPEGKWCHFPVRLERSETHRRAKGADLPFEDERFSYVAFSRFGASRAAGRVVGHPRYPRRRVDLEVCSADGLRQITIGRSSDRYREAKSLVWGSAVSPDLSGVG